jgi:hypothetical protein
MNAAQYTAVPVILTILRGTSRVWSLQSATLINFDTRTTEYPVSQPLAMHDGSRYSAVLSGTLKVGPNVA